MKRTTVLLAGILCFGCAEAADLAFDLAKVKVSIRGERTPLVDEAVRELELHLAMACGAKPDGTGVEFVLGARPDGEPAPEEFASHVCVWDGKVWFWGDDRLEKDKEFGDRYRPGTLFAAYVFLDEAMGVLWPSPRDADTFVPPRRGLTLADGWRRSYVPPLLMTQIRHGNTWRNLTSKRGQIPRRRMPADLLASREEADAIDADWDRWILRSRHFSRVRLKYGHAFTRWPGRYLKAHTDWFGLTTNPQLIRKDTNGRGMPDTHTRYTKFCLSNPEVPDAIIADWKVNGTPKYFNVCPNDGTPGFCECANCLKLDARRPGEDFYASLTDRYVWFWNKLAAKAVAERPDVQLITYIYSYYRLPPRRERIEYPDNMIFGTVPALGDDVEDSYRRWAERGVKTSFMRPNYLCYDSAYYRGYEKLMYDGFQTARRYGATAADFDHGSGDARQQDFENYVCARMLAYPDKGFDEIADEFYRPYGVAAPTVRAVRERIRRNGEAALVRMVRKNPNYRKLRILDDGELGLYTVFGNSEQSLKENLADLRRARALEGLTPSAAKRLDGDILRFEHALCVFRFCRAGTGAKPDLAALAREEKALEDFRRAHRPDLTRLLESFYSDRSCETPVRHLLKDGAPPR